MARGENRLAIFTNTHNSIIKIVHIFKPKQTASAQWLIICSIYLFIFLEFLFCTGFLRIKKCKLLSGVCGCHL